MAANIAMLIWASLRIPVGYFIFSSMFLPRVLGVFMEIAGLTWLANSFAILFSSVLAKFLSTYFMAAGSVGEIALVVWLLVKGVNGDRWEDQAGVKPAVHRLRLVKKV